MTTDNKTVHIWLVIIVVAMELVKIILTSIGHPIPADATGQYNMLELGLAAAANIPTVLGVGGKPQIDIDSLLKAMQLSQDGQAQSTQVSTITSAEVQESIQPQV